MSIKCTHYQHPLFSQEQPQLSVPHPYQPVLRKFIVIQTFHYLTMIPPDSSPLGTALWFRIMHSGYLLSSANMVNMTVTSFHYLMFSSPQILPHHWQYNLMSHHSTMGFHHHFLLAQNTTIHFATSKHVTAKQQTSPQSLLAVSGEIKFSGKDITHFSAPYTCVHTHTQTHLILLPYYVVWFGKFPCFIFHHLTYNQNTGFSC